MSLTANELRYLVERGFDRFVAYRSGGREYVGTVKTITDWDSQLVTVLTPQVGGELMEHRVRKLALSAATKQQVREYYDRIAVDYETRPTTDIAERAGYPTSGGEIQPHRRTG